MLEPSIGTQPRAVIYCRVSTAGQKDGYGLATQEAACQHYCAEHGYTVVNIFKDVFTGTEIEHRPQLRAMRERLRAGDIAAVVCHDPDRASRAGLGASLYLRESVKISGARLEYVLKSYNDGLSGDLMYAIDSWRAAEEVDKTRERTQRGQLARVMSGKPLAGPRAIYGYRWATPDKSKLERDPETAPVVIRIFTDLATGATLGMLARRLTLEGVPTPGHTEKRPTAGWHSSVLHLILRNPAYKGEPVAHRHQTVVENGKRRHMLRDPADVIPLPAGFCPPLVDARVWDAVQTALATNRHNTHPHQATPTTHLLRGGYAVCGYCQSRLYPTNPGGRTGYLCSSWQRRTGCRECTTMSAPLLDQLVWGKVAHLLADPAVLASELERRRVDDPTGADLVAVDRALAAVREQQRNYINNLGLVRGAAAALIAAKLTDLERDDARLNAERVAIVRRQSTWQVAQIRLEDLQAWCRRTGADLDELTFDERRDVLHALNVKVTLYRPDHEPRVVIDAEVPMADDGSDSSTEHPEIHPPVASPADQGAIDHARHHRGRVPALLGAASERATQLVAGESADG